MSHPHPPGNIHAIAPVHPPSTGSSHPLPKKSAAAATVMNPPTLLNRGPIGYRVAVHITAKQIATCNAANGTAASAYQPLLVLTPKYIARKLATGMPRLSA